MLNDGTPADQFAFSLQNPFPGLIHEVCACELTPSPINTKQKARLNTIHLGKTMRYHSREMAKIHAAGALQKRLRQATLAK
jgi:hypothetical protein